PSPPHPSKVNVEPQSDPSRRPSPTTHIPDSIPKSSGGNHGGFRSSQGNSTLEGTDQEAQEASQTRQSGRISAKAEPSVHKDPLFDEIPEDTLDYMETEDAQDVGRTENVVDEEKENVVDEEKKNVVDEEKENAKDVLSTAQ
ncbi:hypothetical protein Tco_0181549, partial [Tanacetum coccineum]